MLAQRQMTTLICKQKNYIYFALISFVSSFAAFWKTREGVVGREVRALEALSENIDVQRTSEGREFAEQIVSVKRGPKERDCAFL